MIESTKDDVVAVTVTYGERRELLVQVLDALIDEGVARIVVVDNGARWPVRRLLTAQYGPMVEIVSMEGNRGSAAGFAAGLTAAMATGMPFIWLLDDDNRPRPGCLARLRAGYGEEAARAPAALHPPLLAVVAWRPAHHAGGVSPQQLMTRWDSFGGFHVADVVAKLVHRLPRRRDAAPLPRMTLGVAPYGGMMFHRSLVERIGLPRLEFGQYGDDTEFTWRITVQGGRIVQIAEAIVDDLEESFQQNTQLRNRFLGALLTDNEFRTYYTFRNLAYFERHFRRRNRLAFAFNRLLYFAILRLYARKLGLLDRYRFIRRSASKGLRGDLQAEERFSLP